tara:strand:- start:110 stop:1639 length:1530 start_codon:yes stop_codon:yes gene_type:complete
MIALHTQAAEVSDLSTQRWFASATNNFILYSQLSQRQTERRANALEHWRAAALQVLGVAGTQAQDPIKTYLYLFDEEDDYLLFAESNDAAYFYSSPRANFIIARNSDAGIDMAKHHYAHFLINNRPIGLPRWFEEGMSQYLSRLEPAGRDAELRGFSADDYRLIAALNGDLALDDLLYDDASLASPRLIQIANLKAAFFVHFLRHGQQRAGFDDLRGHLQDYLALLQQGRSERFAYDQAFELPVRSLAQEFERFVQEGQRRGDSDQDIFEIAPQGEFEAYEVGQEEIDLALAEISLHSARFRLSAYFFEHLLQEGRGGGRASSGLADAKRMLAEESDDSADAVTAQELELGYQRALELAPEDFQLHLDFGQYYDSQRENCEEPLSPAQLQRVEQGMTTHFQRALALNPDSAEVNLSNAQLYLFPTMDWQQGRVYQQKAFASLPADTFVLEQAVEYAILANDYDEANALINRMARPMHFWGTPFWIDDLRRKLQAAQRGEAFDPCAQGQD